MNKNIPSTAYINGGFYDPFVFVDSSGIHVGDCDNHNVFSTVADAIKHAKAARLSGGDLSHARYSHKNDPGNNDAAEYCWHVNAGLQIDAIRDLAK